MILLAPFSIPLRTVVAAKNALYDMHALRPKQLRWPVVSVGNISVGGTGKTPFVIALIEALRRHGYECDVLSRGYGRRSRGALRVDVNGTADQYGDEPLMIARQTGTRVFVGESRYQAGLLAEATDSGDERIHILDDGFQHRQLLRELDIVLVSERDTRDHLLPVGRLREPLSSLRRADEIAVHENFLLMGAASNKPVIQYRRRPVAQHAPKPVAFCGIAGPERFFRDLAHLSIAPVYQISFGDHHRYTNKDIDQLLALRQGFGGASFLTTRKDAVRLSAEQTSRLQPLFVADVQVVFKDADRLVSSVLSYISVRHRTP